MRSRSGVNYSVAALCRLSVGWAFGPHPRPLDRDLPAAEHDFARHRARARGGALGLMRISGPTERRAVLSSIGCANFFMAAPLLRGVLPRFGHHSCTTSSDGAAASIFNSQWGCAGELTNDRRV